MKIERIAWAVLSAPHTLTNMVAEDNHEWWKPLAIFNDPLEAARWQKSKFEAGVNTSLIQKITIKLF